MTTTTDHAPALQHPAQVDNGSIQLSPEVARAAQPGPDASQALALHSQRILEGEETPPAPDARAKLAALLHKVTRWPMFLEHGDEEAARTYVSRLWAEDWDSGGDSVYDDL
ncbi:MAG: hypothetical protein ACRDRY_17745 [Pseudonocardiaceae bacterium]